MLIYNRIIEPMIQDDYMSIMALIIGCFAHFGGASVGR